MKFCVVRCFCSTAVFALTFSSYVLAQPTQLLSVPDSSQVAPDTGSGDSLCPIISADGRYVLFASAANNLVTIGTNNPIPAVAPSPLNVYLRDRVTAATTLVSVNASGTGGGNDNSWPIAISTNGQFALFESSASNLVSGDTNKATDIFVRDLVNAQTILISVNTNGIVGNRDSSGSAMTPDGRYVAFVSGATDLVLNDTNGITDVFVRDLQGSNTVLISVGAISAASQAITISPEISSDGRFVVFTSVGTNLVPAAITPNEVYLRDLVSGTTAWVSSAATQTVWNVFHSTNSSSFNYILSADGQFVTYEARPPSGVGGIILRYSAVTSLTDVIHTNAIAFPLGNNRNLDMTADGRFVAFVTSTNGPPSTTNSIVLVWDAQTGIAALASGDLAGNVPNNSVCSSPVLDSSGRFVAFFSAGTNLVTNTITGDFLPGSPTQFLDYGFHLYRRDLQAGSTVLVNADTNTAGAPFKTAPKASVSADGRFVAFESGDNKLVPRDSNRNIDVFVRDLGSNITELVSARAPTLPSNVPGGPSTLSGFSVSADGRFFAFSSDADNLVSNDTNGCRDIVVRDLLLGTNLLVSANTNNLPANNFSTGPVVSGDGRFVAFTSAANDLVPGDGNKTTDVFMRDLQLGLTTLISVNANGTGSGNKASSSPLISANGRFVLFRSFATDLGSIFIAGTENLFLRDRQSGTTTQLTLGGGIFAAMTSDGHYVAFNGYLGSPGASPPSLYVWDSQSSTRIYTNALSPGPIGIALSPDGRKLVYSLSGTLYLADPVANSSGASQIASGYKDPFRFSADSRYLAATLVNGASGTSQVYVIDVVAKTNLLISHNFNSLLPANGHSDSPDISADGRIIAYRSAATDILPFDTIGVPDIYLYDRQIGVTTLLSQSRFGNSAADNRSRRPVFSGDGKILFFESSASDLVDQTFNFNPNIFAFGTYAMPPFPVAIVLDAQGPLLSWPTVPGKNYQVQFKNNLNDASWVDLSGDSSVIGGTEYFRDASPATVLRFYRVKAN